MLESMVFLIQIKVNKCKLYLEVVKVRTMNCIYNGKTEEGVKSYKSQNKINATYGKNFKVSSDEMGSYSSNPDHKLFGDMKEFNIEYEEPVLTKSKSKFDSTNNK